MAPARSWDGLPHSVWERVFARVHELYAEEPPTHPYERRLPGKAWSHWKLLRRVFRYARDLSGVHGMDGIEHTPTPHCDYSEESRFSLSAFDACYFAALGEDDNAAWVLREAGSPPEWVPGVVFAFWDSGRSADRFLDALGLPLPADPGLAEAVARRGWLDRLASLLGSGAVPRAAVCFDGGERSGRTCTEATLEKVRLLWRHGAGAVDESGTGDHDMWEPWAFESRRAVWALKETVLGAARARGDAELEAAAAGLLDPGGECEAAARVAPSPAYVPRSP